MSPAANRLVDRSRFWCGTAWKEGPQWGAYFRVYGYGLLVTNAPPLFSERYGRDRKSVRVLGIKIERLTP